MIRLNNTTRSLQIVLAGAVSTNQLPVTVSYSDKTNTAYTGAIQLSNTNSTTPVTILSAPAASTIRDVDYINVINRDSSTATVTISYNDNGTLYQLMSVNLSANDQLMYTHAGGWHTQDVSGQTKVTSTGGGGGSGTVTSVNVSGGSTGMSFSGGPVTTSGTITMTGTLDADNGGTGQSSYTTGDLLYANSGTTLTKLNVGSTNQVLTVIGGVPTWQTPGAGTGTVTSVAATQPAAGFTISGSPITTSGTFVFTLSDDLAAVEGLSGTGLATRTAANTWTTRSVSGTTNRITVTDGNGVSGNPTVDIASTYVGQATITTLGTVTTGTWNGTTISTGFGGTGVTTTPTNGQVLIGNGTGYTLATLTAGTGISITNGAGSITINATGGGGGTTFYNVLPANTTVAADTSYIVLSYFNLNGFTLTINGNFGIIG